MTTLTSERRKARREHRCHWCATAIVIGEEHEYWAGVYDGDFAAQRMHADCYLASARTVAAGLEEEGYCPEVYPHPRGGHCPRCADEEAGDA